MSDGLLPLRTVSDGGVTMCEGHSLFHRGGVCQCDVLFSLARGSPVSGKNSTCQTPDSGDVNMCLLP